MNSATHLLCEYPKLSESPGSSETLSGMGLWDEDSTLAVLEQKIIFASCREERHRERRWCIPAMWSFSKDLRGREKLTDQAEWIM